MTEIVTKNNINNRPGALVLVMVCGDDGGEWYF